MTLAEMLEDTNAVIISRRTKHHRAKEMISIDPFLAFHLYICVCNTCILSKYLSVIPIFKNLWFLVWSSWYRFIIQWPKYKGHKDTQWCANNMYKSTDRAKSGDELMSSGRISSSDLTCGTRRIALVTLTHF
jgi:hypothetical protein